MGSDGPDRRADALQPGTVSARTGEVIPCGWSLDSESVLLRRIPVDRRVRGASVVSVANRCCGYAIIGAPDHRASKPPSAATSN